MELIDLSVVGNKFTWFNTDGLSMRRLDRFIYLEGLIDRWKLKRKMIGNRENSYHCLILIKSNGVNSGPKPFKFFGDWI